jgi:hypothetical protein
MATMDFHPCVFIHYEQSNICKKLGINHANPNFQFNYIASNPANRQRLINQASLSP